MCFQALDSLTPFAFQDEPRHFSPVISDIRVTPGGRYDAQFQRGDCRSDSRADDGDWGAVEVEAVSRSVPSRGGFSDDQSFSGAADDEFSRPDGSGARAVWATAT